MKICPKCRYLDHEVHGPSLECPNCGVIYAKVKEWEAEREREQIQKAKIKKPVQLKIKSNNVLRWLWAGLIVTAAIITGIKNNKLTQNEKPNFIQPKAIIQPIIPLENMPTTGQEATRQKIPFVTKYEMRTSEPLTCALTVESNDAPHTIFILLDRDTEKKVALIYVQTGDSISLKVPEGSYRYQMIEGTSWINEQEHFGPSTLYRDGEKVLWFRTDEDRTITLKAIAGNMHPIRTGRIDLN